MTAAALYAKATKILNKTLNIVNPATKATLDSKATEVDGKISDTTNL